LPDELHHSLRNAILLIAIPGELSPEFFDRGAANEGPGPQRSSEDFKQFFLQLKTGYGNVDQGSLDRNPHALA